MNFRLKAFGLHLAGSAVILSLVLGGLYLGWYHWPGWYLTGVSSVVPVLAGVDLALGPLLTLVIASPAKPRRELARDVGIIAAIQIIALAYGSVQLWNGRPLYYAYSETVLQVVQAYDIDPAEAALARERNLPLAPHWYSLPRWIWAPLPQEPAERERIMGSAMSGGTDVIGMPRYYRPWEQGLPALRAQLKPVDQVGYFVGRQKKQLEERMQAAGLPVDKANAIPFTGRGRALLAVLDPERATLLGLFAYQ